MKKKFLILFVCLMSGSNLYGASRLKDIITVKGVRENPLIGYGLVIGLKGTGDGGGEITNSSLRRMFQKLGLNPTQELSSKNVAAVIVTAKLPPFARMGQNTDITVSSIGDSSSLAGGTLLITPLKGGDGEIYAVASGPISIGGLDKGAKFPTVGRITDGAIIEREIKNDFYKKKFLRFSLNNPDFTTAARVERVLNTELGGKFAIAKDSSTIDLVIPTHYSRKVVQLLAIIENFKVNSDQKAIIVINERTGTIVAGGEIFLQSVSIGHGDLTIEVKGGKKKGDTLFMLEQGVSMSELVKALNALGAAPDDIVSILQALKQNGSLVGKLKFI